MSINLTCEKQTLGNESCSRRLFQIFERCVRFALEFNVFSAQSSLRSDQMKRLTRLTKNTIEVVVVLH